LFASRTDLGPRHEIRQRLIIDYVTSNGLAHRHQRYQIGAVLCRSRQQAQNHLRNLRKPRMLFPLRMDKMLNLSHLKFANTQQPGPVCSDD